MRPRQLVGRIILVIGALSAPCVVEGQTPASARRVGIISLSGHHQVTANLRTAREIGLTIPPSARYRADQIIQ